MGFMDGARDCEHDWTGILAAPDGKPYRVCKRQDCQLKLWAPELIEHPPTRGIGC